MKAKLTGLVALLLILSLGMAACSSDDSDSGTDPGGNGTEEADAGSGGSATIVSAEEAANLVAEDPDMVVLDVRTPEEYLDGHIEGALNMNVESPTFESEIEGLVPDEPYLVYCRSGNRSAVAVEQMQDAGFTTLYDMEGGIQTWTSAGYPVVTGT